MPSAMLIYNPIAGRYPSRILVERAAAVMQEYSWIVEIKTSRDANQMSYLASQAVQDELDAIIIVGGDGSINKALPGLVGTDTALGVLPAGTANVWAQELGLPGLSWTRWKALEESAHRLASGYVRQVDVGLCDGKPFLMWAGIGLDAFVVHRIEPRKKWEKNFTLVRYASSVVWSAMNYRGIELRIVSADQEMHGQFMLAEVSNIRLYAGGLATLSPYALLDDGLMELWLFEGTSMEEVFKQVWSLWSGQHVNSDKVRCVVFEKVRLESSSNLFIQMDGEPEKAGEQVTIEVLRRALKVVVPAQAPESLFLENPLGW